MAYTRGSSDDYDRYARVTDDSGWSWSNLQHYIRKVSTIKYILTYHRIWTNVLQNEIWTDPIDGHNTTGQFDPTVHGFHGVNHVSLDGFPTPIDEMVIKTTEQLPEDFPFNLDMNSGTPLGLCVCC